jgi:methyltransferase
MVRVAYFLFLAAVGAERLFEMRLSRRHAGWAFERGGKEFAAERFSIMKLLHVALLVSCAAEVAIFRRPFLPLLGYPMLGCALGAMALRYWAVLTLGPYWNVRVIVVPGATPVTSGPYRYLRHPNYVAVITEGVAIPLVHTAFLTAIWFTLLNAWALRDRIRGEEAALTELCDYPVHLGDRPRFIPLKMQRPGDPGR